MTFVSNYRMRLITKYSLAARQSETISDKPVHAKPFCTQSDHNCVTNSMANRQESTSQNMYKIGLPQLLPIKTLASVFATILFLAISPIMGLGLSPSLAQTDSSKSTTAPTAVETNTTNSTNPKSVGEKISDILVLGNQRIEVDSILSFIELKIGDRFTQDRVETSLKTLFKSQLFVDAKIIFDKGVLTVQVKENPIVNRLLFDGNKKLETSKLKDEMQLREGTVYTRTKVLSDMARLQEIYRRAGRYNAKIVPKIVPLEQNRIDLVFEIEEGSVTGVGSIRFVGNNRFDASDLRKVILTRESTWWRFLSTDDNYDPDRVNIDREALRQYYLKNGFADIRVMSATAELSPDRRNFFLTFNLEEGERYRINKITVTSKIKAISADAMKKFVLNSEGNWFDNSITNNTVAALSDEIGNLGYAFVKVDAKLDKNPENHTLSITYTIKESPKVYIERIDIRGNLRTLDRVVRREFRLNEGDAFDNSKVRRSEQRIRNLGYFSRVELNNAPGSSDDRIVLNARVQDQGTGQINWGLGYSTADGLLGQISLSERNLLGRGQSLSIATTLAQSRQTYDISYTEPYFLNRQLSATIGIYHTLSNKQAVSQYDQASTGGSLGFGFAYTEFLSQSLSYTLRRDRIYNIKNTASNFILEQAGKTLTSQISQTLSYNKLDNSIDPTNGYFVSLGNDISGLGGDIHTVNTRVRAAIFYSLAPLWITTLNGEAGNIYGTGHQPVRISNRYFLGGENLRGFATGGAGPRDSCTGDALGGNRYWAGTAELITPIGVPEEFGMSGRVFSDFGSSFGVNVNPKSVVTTGCNGVADIKSTEFIRVSAGVGMTWKSPFGPIRLDFAWPLRRETWDRKEAFRVSFGSSF